MKEGRLDNPKAVGVRAGGIGNDGGDLVKRRRLRLKVLLRNLVQWEGLVESEVYPRVCGGATVIRRGTNYDYGLSPRVRGSRRDTDRVKTGTRSIPACAGEPHLNEGAPDRVEVYPRVCGGAPPRRAGSSFTQGLSPRVRGSPYHRGL